MVDGPERQVGREAALATPKEVPPPTDEGSHVLFPRYPIVSPRGECAGDLGEQPGVRSYGLRPADERYDAYCYIDGLKGRFFTAALIHVLNADRALLQKQSGRLSHQTCERRSPG